MKSRIILYTLLLVVVLGGWYGWNEYNRTEADASEVEVAATLSAADLMAAYQSDAIAAGAKYDGKYVEVTGVVKETVMEDTDLLVVLEAGDNGILKCSLTSGGELGTGKPLTVRGMIAGYLSLADDDLGTEFGDLGSEPDEIGLRNVIIVK